MIKNKVVKLFLVLGVFILGLTITSCKEENTGVFYSLEEAYDKELINTEVLLNISYYYNEKNNINDVEFEIKPLDPEVLSKKTQNAIKQTHRNRLKDEDDIDADLSGIRIEKYYGTYDDCVIVFLSDDYLIHDLLEVEDYEIKGVKFGRACIPIAEVWCQNT